MKRRNMSIGETLSRYLSRHGEPSQVEASVERVWKTLEFEAMQASGVRSAKASPMRSRRWVVAGAVAATALLGFVLIQMTRREPFLATVLSSDGALTRLLGDQKDILRRGDLLEPGALFRTNVANTEIELTDQSRLELRDGTEFSIEQAKDGLRIHLRKGGVIVNAARQREGHLYVQTQDVTVSVVGTVFLVTAAEEGSRVAVIQGEVRVKHGATLTNLLSGEQLSTNAQMQPLSLRRKPEEHVALLQQSAAPAATPSKPQAFAAVSIRPNTPESGGGYRFVAGGPNGPSWGFGCRGSDGMGWAPLGTGPELVVPLGRCVGNGVMVADLLTYAYATPWRYGSDVADWARHNASPYGGERYFLEAAAEVPSTTTTAQLRLLLQTMLLDRFSMRVHTEPEDIQGYTLRVAKDGLKIKEASGDEELPTIVLLDGRPGIKGKSSLDKLTRFLGRVINGVAIQTPFVDRSGLTGIYAYEFLLSKAGSAGRRGEGTVGGPPQPRPSPEEAIIRRANDASESMEDALGLRLQPEKILTEVVIIDHIEKPSPN